MESAKGSPLSEQRPQPDITYDKFVESYRLLTDEVEDARLYEAGGDARIWQDAVDEFVSRYPQHYDTFIVNQLRKLQLS